MFFDCSYGELSNSVWLGALGAPRPSIYSISNFEMLKIFKVKSLNNKLKSADINKSYQTVWGSNVENI